MSAQPDRSKQAAQIWAGAVDTSAESAQPVSEAALEANSQLVRTAFTEVWNQGRFERLDSLLSPDFADTTAPQGLSPDRQGYLAHVSMLRSAFPDLTATLDQVLTEGNRVAVRLTFRGTHQSSLFGIAPTGKSVQLGGMIFVRIASGKVAEQWAIYDIPGLMQQIGPAQAPSH